MNLMTIFIWKQNECMHKTTFAHVRPPLQGICFHHYLVHKWIRRLTILFSLQQLIPLRQFNQERASGTISVGNACTTGRLSPSMSMVWFLAGHRSIGLRPSRHLVRLFHLRNCAWVTCFTRLSSNGMYSMVSLCRVRNRVARNLLLLACFLPPDMKAFLLPNGR